VPTIQLPIERPLLAAGAVLNAPTVVLMSVVLGLLAVAFVVGQVLKRRSDTAVNPAVVERFTARVRGWWIMFAILSAAFLFQRPTPVVVLFGLISFWALREFITLTPTRLGDHRALFWAFFIITPLQYVGVGMGMSWYPFFSVFIPVTFLFIPARVALAGDFKRFLERTAKIQASLLICVYALSFAPALLHLELVTDRDQSAVKNVAVAATEGTTPAQDSQKDDSRPPWGGSTAGLLFYFILITQLSDVFQYAWDQFLGRRVVAPTINASKTWEGLFGAAVSTALVGAVLYGATPFAFWQSACMAMLVAVMGFAGSLTMSAIKRDRGVKDYGTLVEGHPGVLDRIDSICFAAPVFYHLTKAFFT